MVYETQVATAKRLIEAKGGSCTLRVNAEGAPDDANKPWRGKADGSSDVPARMAFFPVGTVSRRSRTQDAGQQVGSDEVLVAAASLNGAVPAAGDRIQRDGETVWYNIVSVDALNVNGEPIMYTLEVSA